VIPRTKATQGPFFLRVERRHDGTWQITANSIEKKDALPRIVHAMDDHSCLVEISTLVQTGLEARGWSVSGAMIGGEAEEAR